MSKSKVIDGLIISGTLVAAVFGACAVLCGVMCLTTGCASIKDLIDKNKPDIEIPTPPVPDVKPEPPPPPVKDKRDAIDPLAIHWTGDNFARAPITADLTAAWMSPNELVLSNPAPSTWPTKFVKVDVQGIVCLFYHRNNTIFGGKFDWLRPRQTRKGLENVKDGYNGHDMPPGTKAYTCFVSVDGKQRSNIVEVELR